jgi:arabinan endo-1,5-alpha-L-arabinosidase
MLGALLLADLVSAPAAADPGSPHGYRNPVTAAVGDTFADPAVIRGKDGSWYAYGTAEPLWEGEHRYHLIPVVRSADLVHWSALPDVFTAANRPVWAAPGAGFWAPDIRYSAGRYLLYFTVTDTTLEPDGDPAIGVASAPTPAGPWTDAGAPVVPPRPVAGGGFQWTYDPAMISDTGGRHWLYFGSYVGGVFVVPLSSDGLRTTGPPVQVTRSDRYEGAYPVRHDGWYYLFVSAANCCAGPATGYSVFAGRARDPTGPFLDREGISLLASRVGGTPVVQPDGNVWIGTGHNAMATDDAGQDWLVYHAIDRRDPYLDEPGGLSERPMLVDRLDWIDGWPVVRAGAGASVGGQRPPVIEPGDRFDRDDLGPSWHPRGPGWTVVPDADPDSGGLLRHSGHGPGVLTATGDIPAEPRAGLDLRLPAQDSTAGLLLGGRVAVALDRHAGALVTTVDGRERRTALPADFGYTIWHTLTVRAGGGALAVTVGEAGSADPVAEQTRPLPRGATHGSMAIIARGLAELDSVAVAPAARPVTHAVPTPGPGRPDPSRSDEFDAPPGPEWTWVRPDPAATVTGGALRWPAEPADLAGPGGTAGVLLREPPPGDYLVETELTLDLGEDSVRNYEQAGLIAYAGDDDFARLSQVAIWGTRQLEYGRELPYRGTLPFGGMVLTAPARTTWLRLAHTVDAATGEHRFRAGASRDGTHWDWGGTWTFPPGPAPKIGLVSLGGNDSPVTAIFDYFRIYRLAR